MAQQEFVERLKQRRQAVTDMRAANIVPLYGALSLDRGTSASEIAGTIARAVLTEGVLAPWSALAIFYDIVDEHL